VPSREVKTIRQIKYLANPVSGEGVNQAFSGRFPQFHMPLSHQALK
jgi:hypothetical protein